MLQENEYFTSNYPLNLLTEAEPQIFHLNVLSPCYKLIDCGGSNKYLIFPCVSLLTGHGETNISLEIFDALFYICSMDTSDLPGMYAQSPRAAGTQIISIH